MNNHDKLIIKILISGSRNLPNTRRIQKINKGLYPNIMSYLKNRYNDIDKNCKLSEIIYRIYFKQEKRNYCLICGNKTKFDIKGYKFYGHHYLYRTYCCPSCAQKSEITRNNLKETCLLKYGIINGGGSKQAQEKIKETMLKHFGVKNNMFLDSFKEQRKETWIKNYGVDHPLKSKEIKDKITQTCLVNYNSTWTTNNDISKYKRQQTNILKYGVKENLSSNIVKEKIKQTFKRKYNCETIGQLSKNEPIRNKQLENTYIKYGYVYPLDVPEIRNKAFKKCVQKGRSSKNEDKLYELLLQFFDKNDIERQYKEIRYPYWCDFYIKSIDTFIEYQGTWLHGFKPFEKSDENDINKLKYWKSKKSKYYNQGIKTWTINDINKRNKAKESNIRYIEIFSLDNINFDEIKNNLKNKHIIYL